MNRFATWLMLFCATLTLFCATAARADYGAGRTAWQAGRYAEALKEWRGAARKGDARAMLALGRAFVKGLGVPQDFIEAHKWFNLAAARGDAKAVAERDALAKRMTLEEQAEARKLARAWRPAGGPRTSSLLPRRKASRPASPPRRMVRKGSAGRPARASAALRAASAGDASALEKALAAGADPNARGKRGWTPLMYAANKGYTLLVPPLLGAGAKPNLRAADGATALFIAALHGRSEIIAALMKAGADPSIKGPKGKTAEGLMAARVARSKYGGADGLHKALRANERPAVIKALLDRGVDIGARDVVLNEQSPDYKYFYTPLHTAAKHNKHPDATALLLKRGASLNERVESQWEREPKKSTNTTALQLAAQWNENPEVVALLIQRGGGVNGRDEDGYTPLHWAARNKNPELAKMLLKRGADVNAKGKQGGTPLHLAAVNENPEVAKLLLDHGADVNAKTKKYDHTPLHGVAQNKSPKAAKALVKLLIASGADLNVKFFGKTPLLSAVDAGNRAMVSAFPLYERGSVALIGTHIRRFVGDQLKKFKESKGAGADPGWFEGRADCIEYDNGSAHCGEPVCDAVRLAERFVSKDRSEMIALLLDRGAKDFFDPRNHKEDNYQFGSRCMFRVIHRTAKKQNKAAIENWMRRHNMDLNILKWKKTESFTSGQDDGDTKEQEAD
ncbi:MAG: ankyrin repeat domain-containing protein [Nitrospinae bacterium]|nr:ankyrin repeat domain-containing protein [Nitrospinota bacterium]